MALLHAHQQLASDGKGKGVGGFEKQQPCSPVAEPLAEISSGLPEVSLSSRRTPPYTYIYNQHRVTPPNPDTMCVRAQTKMAHPLLTHATTLSHSEYAHVSQSLPA